MTPRAFFIAKIITIGVLLVAMLLFPQAQSDYSYIVLVMCFIGIYIIAVSGLDVLFGYCGQISLGHAAFFAIGAYTSAVISRQYGINAFVTTLIAALFSTLIGILLALPCSRLVHHFLAFATIAFGEIVHLFILHSPNNFTRGHAGYNMIPIYSIGGYEIETYRQFFYMLLILVGLFLLLKQLIINSKVGRAFVAIKDNQHAANGMGVNVKKYKIMAFGISAFYTGLAGALYAHLVTFISPETFMMKQSVMFLTILLFGSLGTFWGPIIGASIITVISEWLQVTGSYQMLIYGFLLLIIVLFLPHGIVRTGEALIKNHIIRRNDAQPSEEVKTSA